MLPIHKLIWHEWRARHEQPVRVPEPSETMEDPEQIRAYVKAYEWGGPTSALQLYHIGQLSTLIRPGDTVLDLACGPGPLLLELAALYPDCWFIGADLSRPMLDVLAQTCAERGITNVRTLCEDIRELCGVEQGTVDVVISTSALHHLPDSESLGRVFGRLCDLLRPEGGVYLFDFGLVRSQATRDLLVADVARKAPKVTALDYHHSLRAAFVIDEVAALASRHLPSRARTASSRFVDFLYVIRTPARVAPPFAVDSFVSATTRRCGWGTRFERLMLETMLRHH